jgi:hypothetical protein
MKFTSNQLRALIQQHPEGLTTEQIASALSAEQNAVAARLCYLRNSGAAVSEVIGTTLSGRQKFLWRPATSAQPKPRKEYGSSRKAELSLDALIESMAEGLVAALVSKVKAKLPAALAGVSPASHLVPDTSATVALPAPEEVAVQALQKPIVGIVGLLSSQAGMLQERFGGHLDLRFWNNGEDKGKLSAMSQACEVVFLHTRHAGHFVDQMLKANRANIRRVTGGVSNMDVSVRAYFEAKKEGV